jgi:hypothetical protein
MNKAGNFTPQPSVCSLFLPYRALFIVLILSTYYKGQNNAKNTILAAK